MRKLYSQLEAAAQACARDRMFGSKISCYLVSKSRSWIASLRAYRVDDPRCSVPGTRVADGPEIEEEHGRDTAAGDVSGGVCLRIRNLDVGADCPQADGAAEGTE